MADYLLKGAITNAVNFPNITAEEAPRLRPWVRLAEQLGLFAGQLTETSIKGVRLEYSGEVATLNTKPLTAAALAGAAPCCRTSTWSRPPPAPRSAHQARGDDAGQEGRSRAT